MCHTFTHSQHRSDNAPQSLERAKREGIEDFQSHNAMDTCKHCVKLANRWRRALGNTKPHQNLSLCYSSTIPANAAPLGDNNGECFGNSKRPKTTESPLKTRIRTKPNKCSSWPMLPRVNQCNFAKKSALPVVMSLSDGNAIYICTVPKSG